MSLNKKPVMKAIMPAIRSPIHSGNAGHSINYYAYFDGVNNYVNGITIDLIAGDVATISIHPLQQAGAMRVLDGTDYIEIATDGVVTFTSAFALKLDGVPLTSGVSYISFGESHSLEITAISAVSFLTASSDIYPYYGFIFDILTPYNSWKLNEPWSKYPIAKDSFNSDILIGVGENINVNWAEQYSILYSFDNIPVTVGKAFLIEIDNKTNTQIIYRLNNNNIVYVGSGEIKMAIVFGSDDSEVRNYIQNIDSKSCYGVVTAKLFETTAGMYMNFQEDDVRTRLVS